MLTFLSEYIRLEYYRLLNLEERGIFEKGTADKFLLSMQRNR